MSVASVVLVRPLDALAVADSSCVSDEGYFAGQYSGSLDTGAIQDIQTRPSAWGLFDYSYGHINFSTIEIPRPVPGCQVVSCLAQVGYLVGTLNPGGSNCNVLPSSCSTPTAYTPHLFQEQSDVNGYNVTLVTDTGNSSDYMSVWNTGLTQGTEYRWESYDTNGLVAVSWFNFGDLSTAGMLAEGQQHTSQYPNHPMYQNYPCPQYPETTPSNWDGATLMKGINSGWLPWDAKDGFPLPVDEDSGFGFGANNMGGHAYIHTNPQPWTSLGVFGQ